MDLRGGLKKIGNLAKGGPRGEGIPIWAPFPATLYLTGKIQVNSKRHVVAHFPTQLNQCRKFDQRSDICFLNAKKTSLTVKSNNSFFWSYFMSKLRNYKTRFQACDTWPRKI